MNFDLSDVLEQGIVDRKLSRRKLAFLENTYEEFSPYYGPRAGSGWESGELDIPGAHYEIQQVAALLDFLKPLPEHRHQRLIEITDLLVANGYIEERAAERFYEEVL